RGVATTAPPCAPDTAKTVRRAVATRPDPCGHVTGSRRTGGPFPRTGNGKPGGACIAIGHGTGAVWPPRAVPAAVRESRRTPYPPPSSCAPGPRAVPLFPGPVRGVRQTCVQRVADHPLACLAWARRR